MARRDAEAGLLAEKNRDVFHVVLVSLLRCISLFVTPWTVACQAPLSMGFSTQEHWIGLLFPPPGDLPDTGIESVSPMSPTVAGRFFTLSHQGRKV